MGGLGSGRRLGRSPKHQVEWCLVLDAGLLAGRPVTPGDEGRVSLRAAMCAWYIEAQYMVRDDGRLMLTIWLPTSTDVVRADIELVTVWLASGGERTYFLCPGLPGGAACGDRVLKLYWPLMGRQAFACRRCHRLAYQSTQKRKVTFEQLRHRVFGRPLPKLDAPQSGRPP